MAAPRAATRPSLGLPLGPRAEGEPTGAIIASALAATRSWLRVGDRRSAALSVLLGACALVLLIATTTLVPVDPLIALPIGGDSATLVGVAFFLLLALAASTLAAGSPSGIVMVSSVVPICAAAALGGPTAAGWIAILGSTERRELSRGFPWYGLVGNHAELTIAAIAGGVAAAIVRARLSSTYADPVLVGAATAAIASLVSYVVARPLAGLMVVVRQRRSFADSMSLLIGTGTAEVAAETALASLMAAVFLTSAWWLTPLFLVPLASVVLAARRYQMAWLADHDPLTGLLLRRELDRRLVALHAAAPVSQREAGLLLIDVDGFKQVNDTLGHEAGDRVLREVANRLVAGIRPADTVARYGGDEFVVLLPGIGNTGSLVDRADGLVAAVATPMEIAGCALRVGLSVGALLIPRHPPPLPDLIASADAAMYEAKRAGGGSRLGIPASPGA
jgi:diguanylate cyclase (GGDEF)-like protein